MSSFRTFISNAYTELKRRRVFGAAAAYIVLAALLIELSAAIFEALLLPDWATRLVTVLFILGFPVVVVLAWFFDISSTGLTRTDTPEPAEDRHDGARDLQNALKRAHASPVPSEPVRRRRHRPSETTEAAAGEPDAERVREATLGHVRHELRTPINGIIGYAEMLLEDADDESFTADLDRIRTAGRRLLDRVDTVLRPDPSVEGSRGELEAVGEKVRADLRTPINTVVGYAEMLMETCQEQGRDHLLPDLERILISARRLLELSEDIVQVATMAADGPGTALKTSEVMTREVLSKMQSGGAGVTDGEGRLLVVDDNETNRDLLSRQLARHGYMVATAVNGKECLERLEKEDYDLILLDVIMPEMDGVETLQHLQADERWSAIPVIMLSSLDEVDSAVRCIEMGALDYVSKPVQPTLLEARIAAALEIRELHRRERAYRKRVAADGVLIGRLLQGAVPGPLREQVAGGALDVVESYPEVTVVRCIVPPTLRPAAGDPERVRELSAVLQALEAILGPESADICLWRPDGFLLVLDGSAADQTRRAADLALDALELFDDRLPVLGIQAGDAVGGMLGRDRPRFEVWGEAVETAGALARLASPGEVLVTPAVEGELRSTHRLEPRGVRDVGGSQIRVHALVARSEAEPEAASA